MSKVPEIYIRKMRRENAKNKLIDELEKHYSNREKRVKIIHGIGNYVLREMLLEEIKTINYVEIVEDFFEESTASLLLKIHSPDKKI